MNKSGPVERRVSEPPPVSKEQIDALISLLTDGVLASDLGEPDHDEQKRDVYLLLHPDVRRMLVQLGRPENRKVLLAILKIDEEDASDISGMLRDYREAKKLGRYIRVAALGVGSFLGFVFTVVKAAPDVLDWIRGWLPR